MECKKFETQRLDELRALKHGKTRVREALADAGSSMRLAIDVGLAPADDGDALLDARAGLGAAARGGGGGAAGARAEPPPIIITTSGNCTAEDANYYESCGADFTFGKPIPLRYDLARQLIEPLRKRKLAGDAQAGTASKRKKVR